MTTDGTAEELKQQLLNYGLVQSLLDLDDSLKEIAIDLLMVIANKPTNYAGMKKQEYTLDELRKIATNYAQIRHPDRRESDIIICVGKVESIFQDSKIDIISFEGLELPKSRGPDSDADAYYSREAHLQNIVLALFFDRIDASVKSLTGSTREREREVLKTWIAMLWNRPPQGPRAVRIDTDLFSHHYAKEFGKEMPVQYIDITTTITDMLSRARLAYPVEKVLCPMWFTQDRGWLEGQMKAAALED